MRDATSRIEELAIEAGALAGLDPTHPRREGFRRDVADILADVNDALLDADNGALLEAARFAAGYVLAAVDEALARRAVAGGKDADALRDLVKAMRGAAAQAAARHGV